MEEEKNFDAGVNTGASTPERPAGLADDDTQYSAESPEVVRYRELFPDVTEEAAIGSVVSIHNRVIAGENPAGDAGDEIAGMIKEKLESQSKDDSDDGELEGDGLDKTDGEDSEEESEEEKAEGGVADPASVNQIQE